MSHPFRSAPLVEPPRRTWWDVEAEAACAEQLQWWWRPESGIRRAVLAGRSRRVRDWGLVAFGVVCMALPVVTVALIGAGGLILAFHGFGGVLLVAAELDR